MRARSSFGLSALGVNFFGCVNFFRGDADRSDLTSSGSVHLAKAQSYGRMLRAGGGHPLYGPFFVPQIFICRCDSRLDHPCKPVAACFELRFLSRFFRFTGGVLRLLFVSRALVLKADIPRSDLNVRFSNRPSSAFGLSAAAISMSLTGSCLSSDPERIQPGERRGGSYEMRRYRLGGSVRTV
jgi:hypothetical protein